MKFHVLTLFPEMVEQGLRQSILGRAAENEHLSFHMVNIRDFTRDKHGKVDDYPYGGGAGMLMQALPSICFLHIQHSHAAVPVGADKSRQPALFPIPYINAIHGSADYAPV